MPHGNLLVAFTEAVLANSDRLESVRRDVLQQLGAAAFVDICATVASFNAVVKVADGTGIPLEPDKAVRTRDVRDQLGLDDSMR